MGDGRRHCHSTQGPELSDIHRTRLELIEEPVRAALSAAGPNATVLDLACNESWFSHRMLGWGAFRAVGIDIRPQLIRRPSWCGIIFEIAPERLELHYADVFDLDASRLEPSMWFCASDSFTI
jgi:hypothetical protein